MIHVTRKVTLPSEVSLFRIRQIANAAFNYMGKTGDVSLVFTDDREIQQLNKEYREVDQSTDVLSFPSEEIDPQTDSWYLGDVIISVERAKSQADLANHPFHEELSMLIVHGCLHLCGLDHYSDDEKNIMKIKQETILKNLGIVNYSWPEEM
jgi:probable rRNA maturation factor